MSRTLEIFEHGRLRLGPGDGELRQSELNELIKFNDAHRGEFFDVGHKHLRAKQYVGYVEVGDVSIEILPKADKHGPADAMVWREGLLEMLRVALGLRLAQLPHASQSLGRNRLVDLIAQAFLAELEPLLHEGLAKGYRTTESNGPVFRGRLKMSAHLRENIARADRFYVEYQTFDHDILVNRALAAALNMLSWCGLSDSVARRVESCLARFPEVQSAGVTSEIFQRIRLGRSTQRYANALVYAEMILAQHGPQLRTGRRRVFALLFDMNKLWERYVAVLLRRAAPPGLRVHTQENHVFWLPSGHRKKHVTPDIVVRRDGPAPLLVIDTKWKVPSNGLPSDDDLKQMFVYNELLAGPRAMLLYPATSKSVAATGPYATKLHTCEQAHVGLFESPKWSSASIKDELAKILAGC